MASSTCHVVGGTKRVRVERIVRCRPLSLGQHALRVWHTSGTEGRCQRAPAMPQPRPAQWSRASKPEACPRRSEEHTSELQSLMRISYAVFCLKKKKPKTQNHN